MAEKGTISSRLELDGEKEYKQALNDAYRTLRVLRSELKAETAELGRNASEQDKARKKSESLKKQIAEQEKVVATLSKALADSKKEYAENQEVQDKWEEKLNKARESLARMKNELNGTEDGLKKLSTGMKAVNNETGNTITTVQTLKEGLTSVKDIFTGVGSTLAGTFDNTLQSIEDFVNKVTELMTKAWTAAGDWKQIQAMFGGDVSEIQAIYTGMGLQGVDSSNITAGIQKLVANTHSENKETLAALKELHISEKDFTSHWDFYVAVMNRLAMQRGNKQDKLARAIFGEKQGSTQNDVLSNWQDAKNKYEQDVEATGLDLSSDEIDKLDEVSHKITEIQAMWDRLQMNVGAKLSEVLNMDTLSDDVLELLRDAAAIFSGEGDRKELVIQFSEDLETFVNDVEEAMRNLSSFLDELSGELSNSENPILRFIGRMMGVLSKFLTFLEKNGDTIIAWLDKILPVVIAQDVTKKTTGLNIGEWITTIGQGVIDFFVAKSLFKNGGTGGGNAVEAASRGGGILAAMKALWDAAKNSPLAQQLGGFGSALSAADPTGSLSLLPTVIGDTTEFGRTLRDGGTIGDAFTAAGDAIADWGESVKENAEAWVKQTTDLWTGYVNWIDSLLPKEEKREVDSSLQDAAENYYDTFRTGGDIAEARSQLEEFTESEAQLQQIIDKIVNYLIWNGGGSKQDLPADFWKDISGALTNLSKDRYTGDEKAQQQIVVQLTANTYLDGELITQRINRGLYDGLNHRMFS